MSETAEIDRKLIQEGYNGKPNTYFGGLRRDWVNALPKSSSARILEIGCAEGRTGELAISNGKCQFYCGIELHEPSAEIASNRLSKVIIGNVETLEFDFEPNSFDAILLSEVLEHLLDPWAVVQHLAKYLKPGGLLFASSPNVSHHRVIRQLLRGRWDLTETGVMDKTHLRWFTPKSYEQLFRQAGLSVDRLAPVSTPTIKVKVFDFLTMGKFKHLSMVQIDIRAHKPR